MAEQKWRQWAEDASRQAVLCAWKRAGISDEEIAKKIGISRSTLSEWKRKYEPIRRALESGREFADRLVENSLFRMTQGYSVEVKKTFKVKKVEYEDGKRVSEKEELQTGTDTEYIKPDIRAIIFYLQNRKPEEWRRMEEQVQEEAGGRMVILSTDDLERMMEQTGDYAGEQETEDREGEPSGGSGKGAVDAAADADADDGKAGVRSAVRRRGRRRKDGFSGSGGAAPG